MVDVEYVDTECWAGGTFQIKKLPLVHFPVMKMKDFIRDCYGDRFEDEDSVESTMLYAMQNFHKWYLEQKHALEQSEVR